MSLTKVLLLGTRALLPGLSHRPALGGEGQDLVIGSPAITRRNEARSGGGSPKGRDCYVQNKAEESEALHPGILPTGPHPGLLKTHFSFPAFLSPSCLFPSLLPTFIECLLCFGHIARPRNKKMSQTQGQPKETYLIQISIHSCSTTAKPSQALPIDHSTLSPGAWAQPQDTALCRAPGSQF